jgi:hypothetical protein
LTTTPAAMVPPGWRSPAMKMKEYIVTVTYVIDARNYDEAVEIAKDVRSTICSGGDLQHPYELRFVETQTIKESK